MGLAKKCSRKFMKQAEFEIYLLDVMYEVLVCYFVPILVCHMKHYKTKVATIRGPQVIYQLSIRQKF